MSARTNRVKKLLAVEASRAETKERELADARRLLDQREAERAAREAAFADACERWLDVVSVEELEQASARRTTLNAHLERARFAVASAKSELAKREAAAIAARTAERRMEILLEGFAAADAQKAVKAERKSADEHAARSNSRGVQK